MIPYFLLPLAAFLVNFFLLAYVWGASGREWKRTAQAYIWLLGACCIWDLGDVVAWGVIRDASALLWVRAAAPGWICAPILVLNVVHEITRRKRDWVFRLLASSAAVASVTAVFTDLVFVGADRFDWGLLGRFGAVYPAVFVICTVIPSVLSIVWAFLAVSRSSGLERVQLRLFAIGITTSLASAVFINVVLNWLCNVDVIPLGSSLTALQSIFVTVAVLRYRFLKVGVHNAAFELFSQASDGVVILDASGHVADVNPPALELLGACPVRGNNPEPLFPPPYDPAQCYSGLKITLPHPQGQRVVLLSQNDLKEQGVVVGKLILLRDITELEAAAQAIARGERRFRDITHSLGDWAWETDAELRYTFASGDLIKLLGIPEQQVLGRSLLEFVEPRDVELVRARFEGSMASQQRITGLVARHVSDGGRVGWFATNAVPILEHGVLAGFRGIHEDITARRQAEEEHAALEHQLRESQERKMVALGQLAGGIAHDFNNMLTGIAGYGELLAEDLANAPEQLSHAQAILEIVGRASGLTRQMLAFARRSSIKKTNFNVHESIERTVALLSHSLGKHIVVETRLGAQESSISGDSGQLETALLNLAVNARDAMSQGGTLSFETEELWLTNDTVIPDTSLPPGRYIRIQVADTGSGMTAETLQHLFEPFFTTKELGRGTGLGLASVHGVVRQHKGHISVETEFGKGTAFSILLPLMADATQPAAEVRREPVAPPPGTTVLLVDDETAIRTTLGALLRKHGYQVLVARDGHEALQIFLSQTASIHVVLLDWLMPHMGGRECAVRLLEHSPGAEIVVMSGYTGTLQEDGAVQPRLSAFLPKPINTTELLHVLGKAASSAAAKVAANCV